jgi:hypothetical protein
VARELRASGLSLRASPRGSLPGTSAPQWRVFLAIQIARMLPPHRAPNAPMTASGGHLGSETTEPTSTEKHDAVGSLEDPNRPHSVAAGQEHGAPGNPAITLV